MSSSPATQLHGGKRLDGGKPLQDHTALVVPAQLTVVPQAITVPAEQPDPVTCCELVTEYTFDELRELPFQMQLGADFSALD